MTDKKTEDHGKAKGGGEGHRKDILLRIGQ